MEDLKLTIDLMPKGAWGHDFSITLPKKDWDNLRETVYKTNNYKCECCGAKSKELHAHEVWDYDIKNKTQTLIDIQCLCPSCHMVKHYRNTCRIGLSAYAQQHFMKVNNCDLDTLAQHYIEQEILFNKRNKVEKWEQKAPLLDELGISYN
jgi:hypothetical protein